jgi:DNA polymerase I-like protein with 3'-5' exonuclease and polymerase domains
VNPVILDIETDALDGYAKIHSIVVRDAVTANVLSSTYEGIGHGESLRILRPAPTIIGHNLITFDLPAMKRLVGFVPSGQVVDTLVLSRLCYPDIRNDDYKRPEFPKEMIGSHSLKAWGYRLGIHKDGFGETADWSRWSEEMQDYCEQDTEVTRKLWHHLVQQGISDRAWALEHTVAGICRDIEVAGWTFDMGGAERLTAQLLPKPLELKERLVQVFPPKKEVLKTKTKTIPFNPGSRLDIARGLNELYGWRPSLVTPSGQPRIDEEILSELKYPEAELLTEYLLVVKRLGQVAEGEEAWIKLAKCGKIHGRINPGGTITGRASHARPNMAQVPASRSPYGKECRSLFRPRSGWSLVGADASGLELRCLSHYLTSYDGGSYGKAVVSGDVHWENAIAFGLVPSGTKRNKHDSGHESRRNQSKTLIYAMIYGAGDMKLGSVVEGDAKDGKRLRASFEKKVPAYKMLKEAVVSASKRGYLVGLDGRRLPIRSQHSALNTLLQSAGAVVMKVALVGFVEGMALDGLEWGKDYAVIGWIHDEFQIECRPGLEERVGHGAVAAITAAGSALGFRCPLDGEFRSGSTWAETH